MSILDIGPQVSTRVNDPASVDAAILSRFSARAFLNKPVDRSVLQEVLELAARAPSGTNTQPWKVYVLQGAKLAELVSKTCAAHDAMTANPALAAEFAEPYDYYPEKWVSPYIDRRRECGFGLYGVLGIGKGVSSGVFGVTSAIALVVGLYCVAQSNLLNILSGSTVNGWYVAGSLLVPYSWGLHVASWIQKQNGK
jgi:nitroreductase